MEGGCYRAVMLEVFPGENAAWTPAGCASSFSLCLRKFFFLLLNFVLVLFPALKFSLFAYLFLTASGLSCSTWDLLLQCAGFSLVVCWLNCPTAHGILVPGPGTKPAFPALAGGSLTTGSPGKSHSFLKISPIP